MPFVNYVKEHTAFIEYAADNGLKGNEILVWEALFHIMNQRANGGYWPDGFIRVKNDRLLTYTPIGFDSLARARNALAQRGLISYKPGKRNTDVPMYEMHFLTAVANPQLHDDATESPTYPVCYPQNTDNIRDNIGNNMRDNTRDNIKGRMSDQYININQTKHIGSDDEEEDGDGNTRGRARAYTICDGAYIDENAEEFAERKALSETVRKAFKTAFGRDATPAESDAIANIAAMYNFGSDMIISAVRRAALHGARSPIAYVKSLFRDWNSNEVTTPDEIEEHEFLSDAVEGRNNYGSGEALLDFKRLQDAKEERRKKHEASKGGVRIVGDTAPGL